MAKTLQHSLAAVLLSTAVAVAAPAHAAKYHEGTKTVQMKKWHKSGKLSAVEMKERRVTAQLNRDSLNGNLRLGSL